MLPGVSSRLLALADSESAQETVRLMKKREKIRLQRLGRDNVESTMLREPFTKRLANHFLFLSLAVWGAAAGGLMGGLVGGVLGAAVGGGVAVGGQAAVSCMLGPRDTGMHHRNVARSGTGSAASRKGLPR